MSEVTYVEWEPSVATSLPSLEAVWNDIWDARIRATELRNIFVEGGAGLISAEPLSITILIKYFRAFGSGRRRQLKLEDATDLSAALVVCHQRFKAIRDWHVSHAVNRYEAHHVTLAVADLETSEAHVTAVSTSTSGICALSGQDVDELLELCSYWLGKIDAEKAVEQARLLEVAKRLSAQELNNLPRGYSHKLDENPFKHRNYSR